MPLYLDEIYLNASTPENLKRSLRFFAEVFKGGLPPGATLVAGPWMSNEDAKIVLVIDIKDHSLTFDPFQGTRAGDRDEAAARADCRMGRRAEARKRTLIRRTRVAGHQRPPKRGSL